MSDDMTELKRVEQKIDDFKDSQKEFNKVVSSNLEKLTEMVSTTQVQQVEINNIATSVNALSVKIEKQDSSINSLKINQALTNDFKGQVRQLKWVSVGMVVAIIIYVIKGSIAA